MSHPSQHVANIVALSAAPVSFWVHAAPVVTVVAGCMGIVWYGILFVKEVKNWLDRHKNKGPL